MSRSLGHKSHGWNNATCMEIMINTHQTWTISRGKNFVMSFTPLPISMPGSPTGIIASSSKQINDEVVPAPCSNGIVSDVEVQGIGLPQAEFWHSEPSLSSEMTIVCRLFPDVIGTER